VHRFRLIMLKVLLRGDGDLFQVVECLEKVSKLR